MSLVRFCLSRGERGATINMRYFFGSGAAAPVSYTHLDVYKRQPDDRVEGTAAAVAIGIDRGADIVRVHDVRAIARVARMTDRIVRRAAPAQPGGAPP